MGANSLAVVGRVSPNFTGKAMSVPHALAALAALGQPSRLEIFRLLVGKEPTGLTAGAIAEAWDVCTTRFPLTSQFWPAPVLFGVLAKAAR